MGGGGGVRRVAIVYVVLGLGAACLALYAISLDPAAYRQLQVQMIKESGPHPPDPAQTATDCAATAAEVMETRADAVLLLLLGAAQAMTAMTAAAATSRVFTVLAMCMSPFTAVKLLDVLDGLIDLAIGRCHGQGTYHQLLVAGYATVSVSFTLLFVFGLVVTLCGQNTTGKVLLSDFRASMQAPVPVATEPRATNSTANTTRQGGVSIVTVEDSGLVRTVPNGTALAAATMGKPAPAPFGGATTVSAGSPSPKQGRIEHGAASTSQAPPPRPVAAPGNLPSQPQGPGFMSQYQQLPALPQLPSLAQLPRLLQPQQGVHGHGVHQAGFTMVLQNVSLSLQGSGTVWVAASGATSEPSRMITQGGAAPMQQSLQLLQLPSPAATGSQLRLTDK